ncbi:chorismate-binding protein, partial [bacterium]|nr:chorismate-binding protein [bacterium]
VLHRGRAWFQVGGGIVADSDPAAEYQETLDKGQRLFQALGLAPP